MKWELLGIVLAFATRVRCQKFATGCPSGASNACYKVNVPDATASGTQKDIYFQIQGPSSLQWIGLGQGGQKQMTNSNIFIVYADASGHNVTLSPRLGVGEVEPGFNKDAQVSLLEGSGIADGKMTANVRCSSCANWGSGQMDLTSSKTQWIWAVKGGSAIKSDKQDFTGLSQHDNMGNINFDLTVAKGGNSLNPFAAQAAPSGTTSSGSSPTSTATSESGNTGASSSDGAKDLKGRNKAMVAHGAVMGLAFALVFPIGSILIRIFSFPGLIWVHAGTQLLAYTLSIVGLGLGIYIASTPTRALDDSHPIIGLLVVCLLAFQFVLGQVHHQVFKRTNRRSFWSTAHVWYGRALITLGIINGGLGLKLHADRTRFLHLGDETKKAEIGYGVVAGIMWLVWMAVAVRSEFSNKGGRKGEPGEHALESKGGSEEGMRGRGGDGMPS
ncbi:hypothetical protein MMC22_010836 [Lobaria immixta]|nr:hypothetical protein [Lobaria immixta]